MNPLHGETQPFEPAAPTAAIVEPYRQAVAARAKAEMLAERSENKSVVVEVMGLALRREQEALAQMLRELRAQWTGLLVCLDCALGFKPLTAREKALSLCHRCLADREEMARTEQAEEGRTR